MNSDLPPLPEGFARPEKHPFDPDPDVPGSTCRICGYDFGFGALHTDESWPDLYADLAGPPKVTPCR